LPYAAMFVKRVLFRSALALFSALFGKRAGSWLKRKYYGV